MLVYMYIYLYKWGNNSIFKYKTLICRLRVAILVILTISKVVQINEYKLLTFPEALSISLSTSSSTFVFFLQQLNLLIIPCFSFPVKSSTTSSCISLSSSSSPLTQQGQHLLLHLPISREQILGCFSSFSGEFLISFWVDSVCFSFSFWSFFVRAGGLGVVLVLCGNLWKNNFGPCL